MSAVGRADLLRILGQLGEAAFERTAEAWGLEPVVEAASVEASSSVVELSSNEVTEAPVDLEPQAGPKAVAHRPTPFLRPVRVTFHADLPQPPEPKPPAEGILTPAERAGDGPHTQSRPPRAPPLQPWSRLHGALVDRLSQGNARGRFDLDKVVDRVARAESLEDLPRHDARGLTAPLWLFVDRSPHLVPLWADQEALVGRLRRLFGAEVRTWTLPRGPTSTLELDELREGERVLALTDLGGFADAATVRSWARLGRALRIRRIETMALTPVVPPQASDWAPVVWGPCPESRGPDLTALNPEAVLTLLAYATCVEPGHLRTIRRWAGITGASPAVEFLAWGHDDVMQGGWAVRLERRREVYRQKFRALPEPVQRAALSVQFSWRQHLPPEIWKEEVLSLESDGLKAVLPNPSDWEEAERYLARLVHTFGDKTLPAREAAAMVTYSQDACDWASTSTFGRNDEVGRLMHRLWLIQHQARGGSGRTGLNLAKLRPADGPVKTYDVRQVGSVLRFFNSESEKRGSWVTTVSATAPVAVLGPDDGPKDDAEQRPAWCPIWASSWGEDKYGRWTSFEVKEVVQRMRWIPPGTFLMGSPKNDSEGFGDERPQHEVTLTKGYWLAETPCTQALWRGVTEKSPSRFEGDDRPVEQVSFDDVKVFFESVEVEVPGLHLRLPTEAEWEYAGRAGTTEPRYGWLDDAAWYDENSGAQTYPVGEKLPNPWGLYDMLGNVEEWCADDRRTYAAGAVEDPVGPTSDTGLARRAIRGGSWRNGVRFVRAAFRLAYHRSSRDSNLGFRIAAGPAPEGPVSPPTESAESGSGSPISRTAAHLDRQENLPVDLRTPIVLQTDQMTVALEPFTRPAWAIETGRDRYGLWATVAVKDARHRLRWIPPGRFSMGSPSDEPGRIDPEGPIHPVTISQGYWLGESPCTQDLWTAVMGEDRNPSRFKTPDRPVEQVSFDDVMTFLERLTEQRASPDSDPIFRLPTEAEWEYACRAGTQTATYAGPIQILGENNAPILDPIAWYDGNSSVDFDLAAGVGASDWAEKQHPHRLAGTRIVRTKTPNAWGLYDTLGNVLEWCADGPRSYAETSVTDPVGPTSDAELADRALRGGSWLDGARSVRAACRGADHRSDRYSVLGFRIAAGPAPKGVVQVSAEPIRSSAEPILSAAEPPEKKPSLWDSLRTWIRGK